jgi:hypothetical protein
MKIKPKEPRPSIEEMREMFHKGLYKDLIPYFKEELRHITSIQGAIGRLMQILEPELWRKHIKTQRDRRRNVTPFKRKSKSLAKQNSQNLVGYLKKHRQSIYYPNRDSEIEKVEALLAIEPQGPPPPLEDQIKMFKQGRYRELVPFYRDKLKGISNFGTVWNTIEGLLGLRNRKTF